MRCPLATMLGDFAEAPQRFGCLKSVSSQTRDCLAAAKARSPCYNSLRVAEEERHVRFALG